MVLVRIDVRKDWQSYFIIFFRGGRLTTFYQDQFNVTVVGPDDDSSYSLGKFHNWTLRVTREYFFSLEPRLEQNICKNDYFALKIIATYSIVLNHHSYTYSKGCFCVLGLFTGEWKMLRKRRICGQYSYSE